MYIRNYSSICTVWCNIGQYPGCVGRKALSCETVLTTQLRLPARGLANPLAGNPFPCPELGKSVMVHEARPGKTVLGLDEGKFVARSSQAESCRLMCERMLADSQARPFITNVAKCSGRGQDSESLDKGQSLEAFISTPSREYGKRKRMRFGLGLREVV